MPDYVCEKCLRVFKQKSGYDDHQSKKKDCSENTVVKKVIENVIDCRFFLRIYTIYFGIRRVLVRNEPWNI